MNSKQKGNIGLGRAISYFTQNLNTVSLPLTDSQDYDLIVDKEGSLLRVQVKFTSAKSHGSYVVQLRSISGSSRKCYKTVRDSNVDILFIVTEEQTCYLINMKDLNNKSAITLNAEMNKFLVS